ncbi:MAG: hypothetical protein HFH39_04180 [Lachnospiraceae bacterium]|nr:hypothetical protein [Lachnospiraceae bacterium]
MSEGIAYQNKDIEFKILSEAYKERSFDAYGLKLPRIKAVLPTNLPAVSANELRMDNLFLLEDGTYALVDYESEDDVEDRIKYMNYISRIAQKYYTEHGKVPVVRMVAIYTGDVIHADPIFDMGATTLRLEQAFMRSLPAEEIYQEVKRKLENGEGLTEKELMQLIMIPLAEKGKKGKQRRVRQVISLAKMIGDEEEQKFVFASILVISDKFIDKTDADAIRREISMTKVGRMIFEDGLEEGRKEGMTEGEKKQRVIAVINMLSFNIPEQKILEKYSEKDLQEAKKMISN